MRSSGKHINGKILESTMRRMLLHAGYGNVEGEVESWIKSWRARHEITFKTVFGESSSVPEFGPWLELDQNIFPNNLLCIMCLTQTRRHYSTACSFPRHSH